MFEKNSVFKWPKNNLNQLNLGADIRWRMWEYTRLMKRWSRSDCGAKAQSKTTNLLYKSPVVPHKDLVKLTLADLLWVLAKGKWGNSSGTTSKPIPYV